MAYQAYRVQPVLLALPVHRVPVVYLDYKEQLVRQVVLVLPVPQVYRALLAYKV